MLVQTKRKKGDGCFAWMFSSDAGVRKNQSVCWNNGFNERESEKENEKVFKNMLRLKLQLNTHAER